MVGDSVHDANGKTLKYRPLPLPGAHPETEFATTPAVGVFAAAGGITDNIERLDIMDNQQDHQVN
jgi:hypothetical protein